MAQTGVEIVNKSKKLNAANKKRLMEHSKKHSSDHMALMVKQMERGKSFVVAHSFATALKKK